MRPASWVRPHTASQRSHAGESAGLRPWAQAIPITPVRSAFEVWLVGRAGRRVGWSRPPHWLSRHAVRRPACGRICWAKARAGRWKRMNERSARKTGCAQQRVGLGFSWRSRRGRIQKTKGSASEPGWRRVVE